MNEVVDNIAIGSENIIKQIFNESDKILNRTLDNIYINTAIKIFIALYAAFAAPKLPKSLVNLFDNIIVRIIFAFCIVFMSTRDPSLAILIAVGFVITLQTANKMRLYNTSMSVSGPHPNTSWLPSSKEHDYVNQTGIYEPQDLSLQNTVGSGVNFVQDNLEKTIDLGTDLVTSGVNLGGNIVSSGIELGGGLVSSGVELGTGLVSSGVELGTGLVSSGVELGTGLVKSGINIAGNAIDDSLNEADDLIGNLARGKVNDIDTENISNPTNNLKIRVENINGYSNNLDRYKMLN